MTTLGTNYGAWIDRSGNITPVPEFGYHDRVAKTLLTAPFSPEEMDLVQSDMTYEALRRRGYADIRVLKRGWGGDTVEVIANDRLTPAQSRMVRDICAEEEAEPVVRIGGNNRAVAMEAEISARADALIERLMA